MSAKTFEGIMVIDGIDFREAPQTPSDARARVAVSQKEMERHAQDARVPCQACGGTGHDHGNCKYINAVTFKWPRIGKVSGGRECSIRQWCNMHPSAPEVWVVSAFRQRAKDADVDTKEARELVSRLDNLEEAFRVFDKVGDQRDGSPASCRGLLRQIEPQDQSVRGSKDPGPASLSQDKSDAALEHVRLQAEQDREKSAAGARQEDG
jgi:hypothetical protein